MAGQLNYEGLVNTEVKLQSADNDDRFEMNWMMYDSFSKASFYHIHLRKDSEKKFHK